MNPATQRVLLPGPAGSIECAIDQPRDGSAPRGVAVVCHPHPQHGGTLDNKVAQTLAHGRIGPARVPASPLALVAQLAHRRQIAEENAAKCAVKLIFPLVVFIFPGIFVVLVGPAAVSIVRNLLPALGG